MTACGSSRSPTSNCSATPSAARSGNRILAVVNLDFHNTQQGWLTLALGELGLDGGRPYQVHDLLTGASFQWQGDRNYVELHPEQTPAHLFRIEQ